MKPKAIGLAITLTAVLLATGSAMAQTVIVGHFGDPGPMNVAREAGLFEEATGWDIEWRTFNSGVEVIAAMASGSVQVSALGSSPLAIGASQGIDFKVFMLSHAIGTSESLIAREGSGIESLEDLRGKRIAVPIGSTSHFSLAGALKHTGIGDTDVTIMNMTPDQIAAAWEQDAIDAAFIWQPVQSRLLERGTRVISAGEVAEWGFATYNAWVVTNAFAEENAEQLAAFARVMNAANMDYLNNRDAWTPDHPSVQIVAKVTGAQPEQIPGILEGYTFVPLDVQIADGWISDTANSMRSTAEFLRSAGRIDAVADDYTPFFTTAIAEAAIQ